MQYIHDGRTKKILSRNTNTCEWLSIVVLGIIYAMWIAREIMKGSNQEQKKEKRENWWLLKGSKVDEISHLSSSLRILFISRTSHYTAIKNILIHRQSSFFFCSSRDFTAKILNPFLLLLLCSPLYMRVPKQTIYIYSFEKTAIEFHFFCLLLFISMRFPPSIHHAMLKHRLSFFKEKYLSNKTSTSHRVSFYDEKNLLSSTI